MVVHMGGRAQTFESHANDIGYVQKSGTGAQLSSLTWTGDRAGNAGLYKLRTEDGTIISFRAIGGGDCSSIQRCAYASEIIRPDGTVYTLSYATTGATGGNYARLARVVSSRGYAILLEGGVAGNGNLVGKACVLNLAQRTLPANGVCPADVPKASYGYDGSGRLTSVVDPANGLWRFVYTFSSYPYSSIAFIRPGESAPWLTNAISYDLDAESVNQPLVDRQVFADGRSYTYTYDASPAGIIPNPVIGGSSIDNLGRFVRVRYGFPIVPGTGPGGSCQHLPCTPVLPDTGTSPGTIQYQQTSGPVFIQDALGRTTTLDYCNPDALVKLKEPPNQRCIVELLQNYTGPDGVKTILTYSGPSNVIKIQRIAKSGSSLADIVMSATYDCAPAANIKFCTKPLTVTDARGNVTTYTYKQENGEVLTETRPPDDNGVQAVIRHTYVLRSSSISNGSGGYVQGGPPVWLPSTVKTCRKSATVDDGCSAGATDEVVTSYDYGPNSGANTLFLRGTVVTGDGVSLRTCYGYDAQGNRISETLPRAGLGSCS